MTFARLPQLYTPWPCSQTCLIQPHHHHHHYGCLALPAWHALPPLQVHSQCHLSRRRASGHSTRPSASSTTAPTAPTATTAEEGSPTATVRPTKVNSAATAVAARPRAPQLPRCHRCYHRCACNPSDILSFWYPHPVSCAIPYCRLTHFRRPALERLQLDRGSIHTDFYDFCTCLGAVCPDLWPPLRATVPAVLDHDWQCPVCWSPILGHAPRRQSTPGSRSFRNHESESDHSLGWRDPGRNLRQQLCPLAHQRYKVSRFVLGESTKCCKSLLTPTLVMASVPSWAAILPMQTGVTVLFSPPVSQLSHMSLLSS